MKFASSLESLEARIAPAVVFKFTDVDGDLVTVSFSKGPPANTPGYSLLGGTNVFGQQFATLDLQGNHAFDGTDILITAKRQVIGGVLRGDGHVDVGQIKADGIPLGAVTVPGDLGKLTAGDAASSLPGVKTLTIGSLGARGTDSGATGNSKVDIAGKLGTVRIAGDLKGYLYSSGGIGSVTVGGSIIGGNVSNLGSIYSLGEVGTVTVNGSLVGGDGSFGASIGAGLKLGNVTIGGSVIGGGFGADSGKIYSGFLSPSDMGVIKIGGDVVGGTSTTARSGSIFATGKVASISIRGDLRGNNGSDSGRIYAAGEIGALTIGGSLLGETALGDSGKIQTPGIIKMLKIGGSVIGGSASLTGRIEARGIVNLSIGGDLAGSLGSGTGAIEAGSGGLGTVTIGGSIRGTVDFDTSDSFVPGPSSGTISSTGDITKLTLGGSLEGTNVGNTGKISSDGKIGTVLIRGSILGGSGVSTGKVSGEAGLAKITVGGSVVGGRGGGNRSGVIEAPNGTLGSVVIMGDLRGGDDAFNPSADNGAIEGERIGSVSIGGSIFAGTGPGAGNRTGAIVAEGDIGSIVVKGSLIGNPDNRVQIFAGGLFGDPVLNNFAIKSLTVGGSVVDAWIFGGVDRNGAAAAGNAQIGTVKVTGDWIASSLATSATSTNGVIGDGNDSNFGTGTAGKIASIVIGGAVLGRAGSAETFGFFAHEIVSFKYGGVALALTRGAATDAFFVGGPNKAFAVGPTLSPSTNLKPDGFAVHVYEV